jgi:sterol desaturase/sphingolipid hydroxylase (fatty acid hydroxylase superfamily)
VALLPVSQILTLLALPLALLLAAFEWWHFRGTEVFELKDSLASVVMGAAYILVAEGFVVIAVVVPVFEWLFQYRLMTQVISPLSLLVLFLVVDLCFYLFHLAAHRVRFMWGVHEVHHASEHFNYTVAFRQSILYAFVGVYAFFIPAVLLGFPAEWVLGTLAVNLLYQLLNHTQWVGRLPAPVEWLFNTPSNHSVHHARNPRYVDRNMGGVLMIWDHLFGTYAAEDPEEPPDYGVVSQIDKPPSYNPAILTFREYASIIADMAEPGPLAQRLKHLWGPPEWVRPTAPSAAGTARKREGPADAGSVSYGALNPADRRRASP